MAYINYNANPKGVITKDCVIRALSKATDMTWDEVYDELYQIGRKKKMLLNDQKVYKVFLKNHGFYQHHALRNMDGSRMTVEEFSKEVPHGSYYIVHTRKHLTVVYEGDIYDTWNTSKQTSGKFWTTWSE